MAREFLGTGWRFPVQVDASGDIATSSAEDDIREAIRIVLATVKGERVMRPTFGCGIHDYVFAAIDTTTAGLIEEAVRDALTLWEPRIEVLQVRVSVDELDGGRLPIHLDYRVRATNNQLNLVFPFYLTES